MNVLLLPPSAFNLGMSNNSATVTNPMHIAHITDVLQASIGDTLKIACQRGNLGTAVITDIHAHAIYLGQVCLDTPPPPKLPLTVVLALPRPKVLRRLILDMTALGVAHIVITNSYRTDKSYWGSPLIGRIDEFVAEGLSQARDSTPPVITFAKRFKPFVQDVLPGIIGAGRALVAHPYADTSFTAWTQIHGLPDVLIVGAEGGFIPYEIELLASVGVQTASLGVRILRTESAVNALVGRWLR